MIQWWKESNNSRDNQDYPLKRDDQFSVLQLYEKRATAYTEYTNYKIELPC